MTDEIAAQPAPPTDNPPAPTVLPVEAQEPASVPDGADPLTTQMAGNEPLAPEPEPSAPAPESTPAPVPQTQSAPTVAATMTHGVRDLLAKAQAAIQFRKRKKQEKILELFAKKSSITNDEVEKLLHVSDATATRYLASLEKEGKIKQVGKSGKAVEYTRI